MIVAMRLASSVLIACFAALAVFGFFGMQFDTSDQLSSCWTAMSYVAPCATIDPFAVVAFHAQAFRAFGMAIIILFVIVALFYLPFFARLLLVFSARPILGLVSSIIFIAQPFFLTRAYCSRFEHSPTTA